jgi:hypothetical protein
MNLPIPTVTDVIALLAGLEKHPLGVLLLILFLLVAILSLWVYKLRPKSLKSPPKYLKKLS